jgi:hypothetical protein
VDELIPLAESFTGPAASSEMIAGVVATAFSQPMAAAVVLVWIHGGASLAAEETS